LGDLLFLFFRIEKNELQLTYSPVNLQAIFRRATIEASAQAAQIGVSIRFRMRSFFNFSKISFNSEFDANLQKYVLADQERFSQVGAIVSVCFQLIRKGDYELDFEFAQIHATRTIGFLQDVRNELRKRVLREIEARHRARQSFEG
jgi:hypothetical protein